MTAVSDSVRSPNVLVVHASMAPQLEAVLSTGARVLASVAPAEVADPSVLGDELAEQVDTIVGFHFPDGSLKRFPALRWLHLTGTGTDHLDGTGLAEDVLVTNSPRVAVTPVAEYAVTGLLTVLKDITSLSERPQRRPWFGSSALTLTGSRVAVVGAGRIGSAVVTRLAALGARCVAVTRTGETPVAGAEQTLGCSRLTDVAASVDHLVCTLPGGDATAGLVGADVLAALPSHAAVVNVGRASTVDNEALRAALHRGRLRGAFVDVHDPEPLPDDDPAWSTPGLIVSPHCGFSFPEEAQEVARGFFENLGDIRAGRATRDTVASRPRPSVTVADPTTDAIPDVPGGRDHVDEAARIFERALREEARLRAGVDTDTVFASIPRGRAVLDEVDRARRDRPPPPVDDPVVVLGLLRTGTSLLHNLLALHPDLHGPLLWELADPAVAGADDAEAHRTSERAAAGYVAEYNALSPDFASIHHIRADRPDECHRLTANTFHSMVLEMRYRVPTYGEWLHRQDMTPAYREHRRALEVIMRGRPGRSGNPARPVIKCPFHTWALPVLARTYPRATIVHLHRDPVEVVASTASLCRAVRIARSDDVDLHEIGRLWRDRILPLTERLAAERDRQLAGLTVLDVAYTDLVADPQDTIRSVCGAAGLTADEEYLGSVRRYLVDNALGSHGVHRYRPEQFGLDPDDLRAGTAAYRHRFGV